MNENETKDNCGNSADLNIHEVISVKAVLGKSQNTKAIFPRGNGHSKVQNPINQTCSYKEAESAVVPCSSIRSHQSEMHLRKSVDKSNSLSEKAATADQGQIKNGSTAHFLESFEDNDNASVLRQYSIRWACNFSDT